MDGDGGPLTLVRLDYSFQYIIEEQMNGLTRNAFPPSFIQLSLSYLPSISSSQPHYLRILSLFTFPNRSSVDLGAGIRERERAICQFRPAAQSMNHNRGCHVVGYKPRSTNYVITYIHNIHALIFYQ